MKKQILYLSIYIWWVILMRGMYLERDLNQIPGLKIMIINGLNENNEWRWLEQNERNRISSIKPKSCSFLFIHFLVIISSFHYTPIIFFHFTFSFVLFLYWLISLTTTRSPGCNPLTTSTNSKFESPNCTLRFTISSSDVITNKSY